MTEAIEAIEEPAAPKPKPVKRRKTKRAKPVRKPRPAAPADIVEPDQPVYEGAGDLAGISASACPAGCTADRCVISTVAICKHPFKTADNGCGPITMANRERARKLIKHQMIDLKG
ncbi:hypothetical protein [Bradyrhizobium sp. SZCCHNRI1073]|uniref:hypothetical protein n=1 Tax=Bradyrhizobium sp. SZCCHNRI1073 TaxID=3057280 RepID=UPI002915D402|nr:hypothetical protein [Bradyrhizobium sp. SZCCHNRI1073]